MSVESIKRWAKQLLSPEGQKEVEQHLEEGDLLKARERFHVGLYCDEENSLLTSHEANKIREGIDALFAKTVGAP
ncbi:MAG TPA: hypothetical protein VFP46_02355 [Candidatus Paceibacterota bacterium]|nr:hypothetical protein [Candidatus Paceibacterota bacterium]